MANRKIVIPVEVDSTGAKQGFDQIKQSGRDMAQAVGKSGEEAAKGVGSISTATEKFTATQTRLLEQLKRTSVIASEGRAAYQEQKAALLGVSEAAAPYIAKLKLAEQGQVQLGMSAKATAAALRGVPAQFTDIITSIQGGQRPLSVFLQQGGQLKDMFGGAGAAARALGGYVLGLVTPFTAAAGVIGALGVAAHQGSEELRAFQVAAILSGNAIGVSASEYTRLRDSIAGIAGTKGKAAEALTEIASNGALAGGQIKAIAEAAILMERATGQAISKTVAQFAELAKSPTDASAKLNEQFNYLTASVYKQIKALEDVGRVTDAANLAERTYAEALKGRATQVIDNAGVIEKAWRGVIATAKSAWDAMLGVGRDASISERAGVAAADVARIQAQLAGVGTFAETGGGAATGGASAGRKAALEKELEAAKSKLALLQAEGREEARLAEFTAEKLRLQQLGIAFEKQGEQFQTKRQQRERELAKAQIEGQQLVAAGLLKQSELTERLRLIREKYNETTGEGGIAAQRAAKRVAEEENRRLQASIASLDFASPTKLTEAEKKVILVQEELKGSLVGVARANKVKELSAAEAAVADERATVALEKQREGLKKSVDLTLQQAAAAGQQADSIRQQAEQQEAANAIFGKGATAMQELVLAQLKLQRAEAEGSDSFDPRYVASVNAKVEAQERYVAALRKSEAQQIRAQLIESTRTSKEETETIALEFRLVGQTAQVRDRILLQRKAELELAKEIANIDKSGATDDEKAKLRAEAQAKFTIDAQNASQRAILNEWQRTTDSINNSLTDAILRGFESGKGFARNLRDTVVNMFKTMVLRPVISAVMGPVSGAVNSALQPIMGGINGLSTASSLASAGNFVSGIGGEIVNGTLLSNIGAGFAGTGGSFASTVGAGLATDALGATVAEGAAAATLGTGSAFGAALAAIPVWGWAALAAAAVASMIANGGETRVGGQYSNSQLLGAPSGGQIDGAGQAITATTNGINEMLAAFGSTARVRQLLSGLEQSETGKGFAYAGGFLDTGASFGQTTDGFLNRRGSKTKEQALAEFGEELKQSTLQALQAANLPGKIGDYLKELGDIDGLSGGALDDALKEVQRQQGVKLQSATLEERLLTLQSTDTENLARARKAELDALDESLRGIAQQIYAEQDLAKVREEEAAKAQAVANERLGLARQYYQLVGDTNAIRDLELQGLDESNRFIQERIYAIQDEQAAQVEAQRAIEKASNDARQAQQEYARSLSSAQSFLDGITKNIAQYIDSLRATPAGLLSPREQLANARSQFDRQLALARGGNRDALSGLTQSADALIKAQTGFSASGGDTKAVIAMVQEVLSALPSQVTAEKLLLDAINGTTAAVNSAALSAADNQRLTREALNTPLVEMARRLDMGFSALDTTLDQRLDFSEFFAGFAGVASETTLKSVFQAIDTNGDGFISRQEATTVAIAKLEGALAAALDTGFNKLDANADSQLTRAEFVSGLSGLASDAVLSAGFDRLDANGDGLISRVEATNAAITALRLVVDQRLATGFAGLDTSLDGLIGKNEFLAGFTGLASDATLQAIFTEIDTNGNGTISAIEAGAQTVKDSLGSIIESLESGFTKLDLDSSGGISQSEFRAAFEGLATNTVLQQLFAGLDADSDGQITQLEAIAARTQATASYTYSGALTAQQMLARLNEDSILSFTRAQMIDFTVFTANGAQRTAAATEALLRLASSDGMRIQFRREGVLSGWYASGGAFQPGGVVTRPTMLAGLGEAGPEAVLPLENVGGRLGVRSTSDERLLAEVRALRETVERQDGDIVINLKNVTTDERVLIEKTLKVARDRARRGEVVL